MIQLTINREAWALRSRHPGGKMTADDLRWAPIEIVAKELGISRLEALIRLKDRIVANPKAARNKNAAPALRTMNMMIRAERQRIAAAIGSDEPMSGAIDIASPRRRPTNV